MRVFKKVDDREPFVANFDGAGGDLLVFISAFVEALPKQSLIEKDMRHFGQPVDVARYGRTISWRMDGGESGRSTQIRLTQRDRERTRESSGVEWEPFWVFAAIPSDSNQGWLMVEKAGRHTLPSEWRKELERQFRSAHHGYRLAIGTVRETSLWSQVENALEDERLIGFEVASRSKSTTSNSGAAGYERGMAKYEREIWKAAGALQKGKTLRQFRRRYTKTMQGTREVELPITVDDLSDERYSIRLRDDVAEIKAVVLNSDGKQKTVVFEGLDPQQTVVMEDTALAQPSQTRFRAECHSAVGDLAKANNVPLPPNWNNKEWEHPANAVKLEVKSDEPLPDQGKRGA